jgi:hypothetical protein
LQNPEEMERQLQVIDGAMLAQVRAVQSLHTLFFLEGRVADRLKMSGSVGNWPNYLPTEIGRMTK